VTVETPFSLLRRLDQNPALLGPEHASPLPEGQFLGIVGLQLDGGTWAVAQALRLQPIWPRSGAHEVSRALSDDRKAAIIGRYSSYVGYELAVAPEVAAGEEAVSLGKNFIALLRVKALPEILVPAALTCSWSASVLNQLPAHSCDATLIEDNPNLLQLEDARPISADDLNWIFENLSIFTLLNETNPAYTLAVDSLCQHNHQTNLRMAAAMLWSGIEALFGIKGEITHKLALYVAAILEQPGEARFQLFRKTKEEYNTRSRVVHGESTDLEKIRQHIIFTRGLLSRLVCRITENQGIPSIDGLDRIILGESATPVAQSGGTVTTVEGNG